MRCRMIVALLLAAGPAWSAPPATQPAATGASTSSQLQEWFIQLASPDPGRRAEGRRRLLNISPRDLEALREVARSTGGVLPAQGAALREIVAHVVLTQSTYQSDPINGWLGIRMQQVSAPSEPVTGAGPPPLQVIDVMPGQALAFPARRGSGIMIGECFPGFAGYKALNVGDIVIAARSGSQTPTRIRDTDDFQDAIRRVGAGHPVTLDLLRNGQPLSVEVKLDPRPIAADGMAIESLLNARKKEADAYWQNVFAPLLARPVG